MRVVEDASELWLRNSECVKSLIFDWKDMEADNDLAIEAWKKLGNDAFGAGDFTAAVGYYTQAIEIDPSNAVLFSNRAAAFTKIEEYQKAKFDADMCIELRPKWSKGYWRKGAAQIESQEYRQAVRSFELGLEYNPTDRDLVEGKRKALQYATMVDSVVSKEFGEFDIDGPSQKSAATIDGLGPAQLSSMSNLRRPQQVHSVRSDMTESYNRVDTGSSWPLPLEMEITRILNATNHYEVLNLGMETEAAELKKHYYILAKMLHPDKCKLARGEEAMKDVSISYETLMNPGKRRLYDEFLSSKMKDPEAENQTYAEWEARQMQARVPKWLQWIAKRRGCVLVLFIILAFVLLPLVLSVFVILLIIWLIFTLPKELVLKCCFPDKYELYQERKMEENRRAREKMDERYQDELHRHL